MTASPYRRWLPAAVLLGLAALPSPAGRAGAQDFPTRPVRLIVPYPAGGTADVLARIIGDWLARKWGEAVVIENRSGAAGNIAAEVVALSPPDGHTLLATPPAPLAINQNLYPKLPFDPAAFVPVAIVARVPNALVAGPSVASTSVAELIAYARANPGKLTYASQGNGTTSHLTAELFKMMTGAHMVHVPYRGSAPALNGLLTGEVDLMFDNLGVSLGLVSGGKLKLLGVASEQRLASLPDTPALNEALPGFVSGTWFAIVAPPGTPRALAGRISADVAEALRQPATLARLQGLSAEPVGADPESTAAFIRQEIDRWDKVIKAAGVKLE